MAKQGSVAPKERINIVYRSKVEGQEDVELPFKMLIMEDLTLKPKDTEIEEREPVKIDRDTFNEVMSSFDLGMDINVKDRLGNEDDGLLPMHLKFKTLKDFTPDGIANQVPELQALLELRDALAALRSPLGNKGNFRKRIQSILSDDKAREQMLKELGLDDGAGSGEAPAKEDE
ncbi:MAG: type VI secretion system contractile sheath small subunit [Myxococcales bacterium]|nr:type VI secretion system contractile sheath small subunit [Myxococcales bacterium]MCB9717395.1 type VI secretion system contractile sheath small subunit [Myxococcales bacterium]